MSTEAARPSLDDVGNRRSILALGASGGVAPAAGFGVQSVPPPAATRAVAPLALSTLALGALHRTRQPASDRRAMTAGPLTAADGNVRTRVTRANPW